MKLHYFTFVKTIAFYLVMNLTFADNTSLVPGPYPSYTSAVGIPAHKQVAMQALWLHLNANRVGGVVIPKSFEASGYWPYMAANNVEYQKFRLTRDSKNCVVPLNNSNDATIERAMQQQGLDVYDGAVWQIALALAAKNGSMEYIADVEGFKNFLVYGVSGGFQSYYAFKNYSYNGKTMPKQKNAYILKFISPTWAGNYDAVNDCQMQWPEWSAVTGEESWAAFIGPIQSIYLLNNGDQNSNWSQAGQANDYIELGKNALPAILQMQAPSGGVYRNVTLPGQTQNLDISLENNFSLYAGIAFLEQALKSRDIAFKTTLQSANLDQKQRLEKILASDQEDIKTIHTIKKGLVNFFTGLGGVPVFDKTNQFFYASVNGTTPDTSHFAVDVQTWGATVIASIKKDPSDPDDPDLLQAIINAYGTNVLYNILQTAIIKSAYTDGGGNLLGVGYTTQKPTDSFYELSGEWTLGAINAAIVLADYYKADTRKSTTLINQAQKMLAGVTAEASSLQGSPSSPTARVSYLYANKRAFIPFGWFSNKVPSTASTAWSLMINLCFNPFELGGGNHQTICQQLNLK